MMGVLPCRAECMDFDVHCRPCRLSPLLWSPARVLQWPAGNDGHSRSGNESAVVRATIAALSASGTGRTAQADSSVLPCFAQPHDTAWSHGFDPDSAFRPPGTCSGSGIGDASRTERRISQPGGVPEGTTLEGGILFLGVPRGVLRNSFFPLSSARTFPSIR